MRTDWSDGQYEAGRKTQSVIFRLRPDSEDDAHIVGHLEFQDGPVSTAGENGVQTEDVLAALIKRLQDLNTPPMSSRETSLAITHLQEAEHWLWRRTLDRRTRNVEGTDQP